MIPWFKSLLKRNNTLILEIDESKKKRIQKKIKELGLKDEKELLNSALVLFFWASEKKKGREKIGAMSEDNVFTEVDLLALSPLAEVIDFPSNDK